MFSTILSCGIIDIDIQMELTRQTFGQVTDYFTGLITPAGVALFTWIDALTANAGLLLSAVDVTAATFH
jgi:hypothetical protein